MFLISSTHAVVGRVFVILQTTNHQLGMLSHRASDILSLKRMSVMAMNIK